MGPDHAATAVAELTRDRDWEQLWLLALELPLAEAVAAVARLDRQWRPADEPGRELRSRLAAARPGPIRAATAPPSSQRLSLRWLGPPFHCWFAPDGRAVAVGAGPSPPVIYYELPGGRRQRRFHAFAPTLAVFDGGMVFAALGESSGGEPWMRYRPGGAQEVLGQVRPQAVGNRAAAVTGGFVIAEPARLLYGTAEAGSPLRDVTPPGLRLDGDRDVFHDLVPDPLTGRLAVHIMRRSTVPRDDVLILGPDFSVASQLTVPFDERWRTVHALGFCRPDRFITLHRTDDDRQLRSWAIGPPAAAEADLDLSGLYDLRPLPYTGLIRHRSGYLDGRTLGPAARPGAFTWEQKAGGHVTLSPDGGYASILQARLIEKNEKVRHQLLVRDLVQEEFSFWAARPMADFSAGDRAAVAVLGQRMRGRAAEPAAVLLRDCLDYRRQLLTR